MNPRIPAIALAVVAAALLAPLSGYADGGVSLGSTTLLLSGDPADKYDIVFLGDGFTEAQQGTFNTRVDQAMAEFLAAHPLEAVRSAFNVHRVNVTSPESGTDRFSSCGGDPSGHTDQSRRTALDTGYCSGGGGSVYRCMGSADHSLALGFAAQAPDDDLVVVLVNDTGHGGCAFGDLTYFTIEQDFEEMAVHEFGHAIFDLADEYNYDGPDRYAGGEPGRPNVTIETDRTRLKWRELVLAGTPIPTQAHPDCSESALPPRTFPSDIVGTFESANYSRCGIYRPQYACRMRRSEDPFCSVCRRRILRRVAGFVGSDLAVSFTNLLIRNDHDGWLRGKGEIYLRYELRANAQEIDGRWPAHGESKFDSGDSKSLDVLAGTLPGPVPGSAAAIEVRVRENDWPDGDDTVRNDTTQNLPSSGAFTVDRQEYRLRGRVEPGDLRVLLDVLHLKDDHELLPGNAEISVIYTVSNGTSSVIGRWPSSGTVSIPQGGTRLMSRHAASLARPGSGGALTVRVRVREHDPSWIAWLEGIFGIDDEVADDTFSFSASGGFGAAETVHVRDRSDYRITFSVAEKS